MGISLRFLWPRSLPFDIISRDYQFAFQDLHGYRGHKVGTTLKLAFRIALDRVTSISYHKAAPS